MSLPVYLESGEQYLHPLAITVSSVTSNPLGSSLRSISFCSIPVTRCPTQSGSLISPIARLVYSIYFSAYSFDHLQISELCIDSHLNNGLKDSAKYQFSAKQRVPRTTALHQRPVEVTMSAKVKSYFFLFSAAVSRSICSFRFEFLELWKNFHKSFPCSAVFSSLDHAQ